MTDEEILASIQQDMERVSAFLERAEVTLEVATNRLEIYRERNGMLDEDNDSDE